MTPDKRAAMASSLRYFWEAKGDIERWVGFDKSEVTAQFPEIMKAWEAYKAAEKALTHEVREAHLKALENYEV